MSTQPQKPQGYGSFGSSLRDLPRLRHSRRRRESSWDRTGGNQDRLQVTPGASVQLADLDGPGSVQHIWATVAPVVGAPASEPDYLRKLWLKITWDDESSPSVFAPLSDFFGVGHGKTVNFASAPLQMSPEDGQGLNCFFHMPFAQRARFEVVSELSETEVYFYYYIDWEELDALDAELGYFHAQYREQTFTPVDQADETNHQFQTTGTNLDGLNNYTILEARGRGHYVGCVLSIKNLRQTDEWNWYGEGDDMIFIDGEPFPPSLHGTGTEDYFNTAWCPTQSYAAPYHGLTLPGGDNWSGEISMYRFHVEDPVSFRTDIRVSIEHGHANKRGDAYSSVAYWYQTLPHQPFELINL